MANKKAKESGHEKYKMAAVLLKGGNVLSHATNDQVLGHHAEIRALNKVAAKINGATIIVMRSNGRVSRPCRMCFFKIRDAGVATMIFVDEAGDIVRKRVNQENSENYKPFEINWLGSC